VTEQKPPAVGDWQLSDDELIAETRVFTLRRHRAVSPADPAKSGEFVYIDAPDWVNIIALTAEREVVLIEQYRHGTHEVTLEIPGGTVDDGEDPLRAGLRELREETGYEGAGGRLIGFVTPNPAMMNNRCHTVLVREVERRREPALDGLEEIHARLAPLEKVPDMIRSGAINHALVVAAFHHLLLHEQQRGEE
jgi:8-oxo-dGTP pyrophosphatase MutT (NUDIX family)